MVFNPNEVHKNSLSIHDKLALKISSFIGSMACAYLFCIIALISLPGAIATGNIVIIIGWLAQTFLQLVLLSIIMVSQNLQQRHADLRAESDYRVNVKAEKEVKEIHDKLDKILKTIG